MSPQVCTRKTITVNGEPMESSAQTVADLLAELKLAPIRVAVEINEKLGPRKEFSNRTLMPGDRVEVVTFVGGG